MFSIPTKPDRLREPKIMEGNKGLWVMQQWRAAVCSTVTQGSRAAGKLLLNQNRLAKIHCWLLTILTIAHTHKSNSTIANAIIVSKGEGQSGKVNTATSVVCVCVCWKEHRGPSMVFRSVFRRQCHRYQVHVHDVKAAVWYMVVVPGHLIKRHIACCNVT